MSRAPNGALWRPSTLSHLRRIQILEDAQGWEIGSVGPVRGGRWMNRDTGQEFDSLADAKADVERYL